MFKRITCILLTMLLLFALLPLNIWAEETDSATFTGMPPEVKTITVGDVETFLYGGTVWSARSTGVYPNNPPASVDTVEEKVDWIADQCRAAGVTDPWEIALWLHNWLIYNATYDYTFSNYYEDGVLLLGTGVCNSYALAYGLLLDEFGIENIKLDAPIMNHAWNLVKLNGEWCHVDCTWDDPGEGGYENFTYFGMDDELIGRDHEWDTSAYPACTSRINYYLLRSGKPVASNKAEMMMVLCNQAQNQLDVLECNYIGTDPSFSAFGVFREWYDTFNWKYGIYGWSCSYTDVMITVSQITYSTPWDKPADFDQIHTHCYITETKAPTCAEQGYTTYICPCEYTYQGDYVAPTGKHTYSNAQDTTCNVCGFVRTQSHSYDDNVDGTCNVCGVHRETVETRKVTHMFRMYNPNTGEHFYTGSEVEKSNLVAVGWQYEGVGFTFPANTGAPVYRLFQPSTGEHLYTMDEYEKATLMANGWNYEGIAFNSAYDTEAVQHRLHNPNATVGAYHFTFSEEEVQNLLTAGWEYQGIGWYSCWK